MPTHPPRAKPLHVAPHWGATVAVVCSATAHGAAHGARAQITPLDPASEQALDTRDAPETFPEAV